MDNKLFFGIMTLLFNAYGAPCFMKGEIDKGVLRVVLDFVTFGIVGLINRVIGFIVGIQVLCMTDEEFAANKDTIKTGIPD